MLHYIKTKNKIALVFIMMLMLAGFSSGAQQTTRLKPVWWFGESGAVNINQYRGTTQQLSDNLLIPTVFHKGKGVRPYISLFAEYRPGRFLGGMLNLAYDNRGGKFDGVMAPCNCPATLSTNISYFSVEPSLRVAPFGNAFYLFAGPVIGFNVAKSYTYKQEKQVDKTASLSDIRKTVFSAQAGTGVDIPLSKKTATTQVTLSPFAAFITDLGQQPRTIESWSIYTIRAGIALKFGTAKKPIPAAVIPEPVVVYVPVAGEKEIQFSVRAPKVVPLNRFVRETFPLRNSVFFDMGSTTIPVRYVQLDKSQAISFKEDELQESPAVTLANGRSARQLAVYHNILNIKGDRLRSNPQSSILLTGSADKNPAEGKQMAENVKQYLVDVFGIDPVRIVTAGRDKPVIPSEQPGGINELDLLRLGDRRVDIESTSPELLLQVGGKSAPFLRPVQIRATQQDPLDSHILFNVANAEKLLKSWKIDITDEQGNVQHYGPYFGDQASVAGKTILGKNTQGNYKVEMTGTTIKGLTITKESSVSLMAATNTTQEGLRYSILFDFDRSKSIEMYEKFLAEVVTPLIPENGTVIIHGHTDIIGEVAYNRTLSEQRAKSAQQVIERALAATGKQGVKFEVYGFGEDESMSPFENVLVEERFYNRTVIIDIIKNN
jgi:outer membrane protein OmpA-like peptidoglycan-associated protein